jgi:lipopolysaccharide/colanic/teichoic acid biosynthesis glycosyltransferase
MVKRLMDITAAAAGLLILSPILITVAFIVFLQDFHNPLYIAPRVGKQRKMFNMVKLRSMIVAADKSGVDSTSSDDKRITWIGRFIRKIKLDEITQLWNVLIGDMSLVGPRPNVERDVAIYTEEQLPIDCLKKSPVRIALPDAPAPTSRVLEEAYYTSVGDVAETVIRILS